MTFPMPICSEIVIPVHDYDLQATLNSGQAFRWRKRDGAWEGVIGQRWVRLVAASSGIVATTCHADDRWDWLTHYLQADISLDEILKSFPEDRPLRESVAACRGLRLLRQDPWECLASFICSSTKQIVQIQQIIELLCHRYGEPLLTPEGSPTVYSFPSATRIAALSEKELRDCKMGFRAPYFRAAAQAVEARVVDLEHVRSLPCSAARSALTQLAGVGDKIANCVLLFAYGFAEAFPVDVWVMKALRELYFPRRRPKPVKLRRFVETYFGPNAGYAQQYLFHFMRTHRRPAGDDPLSSHAKGQPAVPGPPSTRGLIRKKIH
jgi:N-glycosylase/DNA lyase